MSRLACLNHKPSRISKKIHPATSPGKVLCALSLHRSAVVMRLSSHLLETSLTGIFLKLKPISDKSY
jgi:hypothetical protein